MLYFVIVGSKIWQLMKKKPDVRVKDGYRGNPPNDQQPKPSLEYLNARENDHNRR